MPYLFNSLVFLIILTTSLNFSPSFSIENKEFILPQKKISTINSTNKKPETTLSKNNSFNIDLPKKKPLKKVGPKNIKEFKNNKKDIKNVELPKKKPFLKKKIQKVILEKKEKKTVTQKKDKIDQTISTKKIVDNFIYPLEKPLGFKVRSSKQVIKSNILNTSDYIAAKEIINLIKKKKWDSALSLTKNVKDKEFHNLINWMYLKENNNKASFNDYVNFISKNPDYPRINRLRYLAEQKIILKNTSPYQIINWFKDQEPLSGTGKVKLGEAYLDVGENALGVGLIKSGWITAKLSSSDLKFYRKKFKNFISSSDHLKRADYLAWNNKYWDLKRMLRYLPKNERLLYNARFILMTHSYGVDKAIADVPYNLKNDVGLKYDRLKWRNRRNRLESSLEILEKAPKSESELVRADLWWKQRKELVRDLIYKKDYERAYAVSSNHYLSEGPEFAEAEWLSGWLALSFLNKPKRAIEHFEKFYENVGYPISRARGAFWLGLSHEKSGNSDKSKRYYEAGSKFTNTYYGQLSFNKISYGQDFKLVKSLRHSKEYEKEFNKNKLIRHVKLLKELDKTELSKDII